MGSAFWADGARRFSLDAMANWIRSAADRLSPAARVRIFLYLILAFQCSKIDHLVPFQTLFDGNPLMDYRYAQIDANVENDRRLAAAGTGWVGYDPFVAVGMPVGVGPVPESHAIILFDRLLRRWTSPDVTIKLFVWLALLAGPLLIFGAARMFEFDTPSAVIVTALAAAGTAGHGFLSRALIVGGDVAYWLGGPTAIFSMAALYRGARCPSRLGQIAFLAAFPMVLLLDPGVFAVVAVPIAAFLLAASPRDRWRAAALLAGGAVVAAGLNNFWLRPWLAFHPLFHMAMSWPSRGLAGFDQSISPAGRTSLWSLWGIVRGLVLLSAVYQLTMRRGEKSLVALITAWLVALFLVGFFGGEIAPLREMEPGHLPYLLFLALSFPASVFFAAEFLKPGSIRIVVFGWALWTMVTWQARSWVDCYPMGEGQTVLETSVLDDLHGSPPGRRVLVEYSPALNGMMGLAATADRAFIGIPTTWRRTMIDESVHFSRSGGELQLFGAPLSGYDEVSLKKALDRYNIGTIVATSAEAHEFFNGLPDVVALRRLLEGDPSRDHWVYDVVAPGNGYVLSGRAGVWFTHDRIGVRPAASGPLLLSFHWIDGLRVPRPLSIHPRYLENDPLPFIEIENPAGQKPFVVDYARR